MTTAGAQGKQGPVEQQGTGVLEKGTRLGEYEIERLLGVGSMGAVYEGVCTATGHRHAIKVLSPALAAVPTARARFLKEADLTARVRHPHIVQVSDVGEDAGRSYFVMELLNGEDLGHRLQRAGTLSVAETVDIMLPVCDAVAEAHRRRVTHRDLKPSNIFLLVRGRRPHPVVLDFGIAEDEQDDEQGAGAAGAAGAAPARRAVFGTPYYLAPEQVADHQTAGPASDQYALGVIVYECLTGQPPYRGNKVEEVFRAIAAGKPTPPSTRRPDVPPDIDAIVLRALSVDPKARFASVADLRRALEQFSSRATGATSGAYKRTPSSPAIEVEARTPTPFVRTLTPEVEALDHADHAWFEAGEAAQASAGETASPPAAELEFGPDSSGATVPPVEVDGEARGFATFASRRVWIAVASGVAVGCLALVLVMKRGSAPDPRPTTPSAALVHIAPSVAKPPADSPPVAPAPEAIPVSAAPAPAPREAPAAAAPAPAPREAPAPVVLTTAPTEAREVAPTEPPAAAPAAVEPSAAGKSRARKPADRPRARGGVRMHNGVPLLD